MPEREAVTASDYMDLSRRWKLDPSFIYRLQLAAEDFERETRRTVVLISGWRSRLEQERLGRSGRPAAPDNVSTHRSCPATGADVSFGHGVVRIEKHIWGRILMLNGLRMGGGSKLDENGIPTDWQHVDAGPR